MSALAEGGEIFRQDGKVIVRFQGEQESAISGVSGIECENPSDPPDQVVRRKMFGHKRIYLPNELDTACTDYLSGNGTIVIGMTGYSQVSSEQCREWGVKPGAYEYACMEVLAVVVSALQQAYPGIQVRLVHGASNMGVDRAVMAVARRFNLSQLGFSCPRFMFFVTDDDIPVYVAPDQDSYSNSFVGQLDLLFSVGGRLQAFEHDMSAVLKFGKHLTPLDVLGAISPSGGPPARTGGLVTNAPAAFAQAVLSSISSRTVLTYEELLQLATWAAVKVGRLVLPPEMAYGKGNLFPYEG